MIRTRGHKSSPIMKASNHHVATSSLVIGPLPAGGEAFWLSTAVLCRHCTLDATRYNVAPSYTDVALHPFRCGETASGAVTHQEL